MFTLSRTVVATSLAALVCLSAFAARAETILGEARIVDGDTVDIGEKKIRLHGIDAPETDQLCLDTKGEKWACGIAARDALTAFSKDRPWSCDVSGRIATIAFSPRAQSPARTSINGWYDTDGHSRS